MHGHWRSAWIGEELHCPNRFFGECVPANLVQRFAGSIRGKENQILAQSSKPHPPPLGTRRNEVILARCSFPAFPQPAKEGVATPIKRRLQALQDSPTAFVPYVNG